MLTGKHGWLWLLLVGVAFVAGSLVAQQQPPPRDETKQPPKDQRPDGDFRDERPPPPGQPPGERRGEGEFGFDGPPPGPRGGFNEGQPPRGGRPGEGPRPGEGRPGEGPRPPFGGEGSPGQPPFGPGGRPMGPGGVGPPLDARRLEELKEYDPEMYELEKSDMELNRETLELADQYRRAPRDRRSELRQPLVDAVGKHFDVRQARRELHLKRLSEELETLRTSIEQRKKVRPDIIDKRVSELIGDEDELAF